MIDTDGIQDLETDLKIRVEIEAAIAIGTAIGIGSIRIGAIQDHLRLHRRRRRARKRVKLRGVRRGSFDSFTSIYIGVAFFFFSL